ncbi:uncharacterized protein LOC126299022 [Schistocerca gregaria]|uniref:uncharacterized protein LOC126299022 n=1 Tax=Schistocerca gregaria TaxID=7010 RepID=UPI00211E1262|nr:uncharacterized protein LOC126299022 [Schistocerca gregaria]
MQLRHGGVEIESAWRTVSDFEFELFPSLSLLSQHADNLTDAATNILNQDMKLFPAFYFPLYPTSAQPTEPQLSCYRVLLFNTTYQLTAKRSKHFNVGLAPNIDFKVVLEIGNVQKGTNLHFRNTELDQLCSKLKYIGDCMTAESIPFSRDINIFCSSCVSIINMFGGNKMRLKSQDPTQYTYLKHLSFINLRDLYMERLSLWQRYIKSLFDHIVKYLLEHEVHDEDEE